MSTNKVMKYKLLRLVFGWVALPEVNSGVKITIGGQLIEIGKTFFEVGTRMGAAWKFILGSNLDSRSTNKDMKKNL